MNVRTGRQSCCTDQADHAVGADGLPGQHPELGEVTVVDTSVSIDINDHKVACSIRVHSDICDAGRRRMDFGSTWRRKVDARMYVATRTERIERLQLQRRAATTAAIGSLSWLGTSDATTIQTIAAPAKIARTRRNAIKLSPGRAQCGERRCQHSTATYAPPSRLRQELRAP
jgi:hypothetical protein